MKSKYLWILWPCLYVICMIAGFIPNPAGFGQIFLVLLGLIFFIPGGMLFYNAYRKKDKKAMLRLRIVSLSSLVLTVLLFIANLLSVYSSDTVGIVLDFFLRVVSVPMFNFPMQYWLVSLFLWSFLFVGTFPKFYRR